MSKRKRQQHNNFFLDDFGNMIDENGEIVVDLDIDDLDNDPDYVLSYESDDDDDVDDDDVDDK